MNLQRLIEIYGITGAENIILECRYDVLAIEWKIQKIQLNNLIRKLPKKKTAIVVFLYVIAYTLGHMDWKSSDLDIITETLGPPIRNVEE